MFGAILYNVKYLGLHSVDVCKALRQVAEMSAQTEALCLKQVAIHYNV
jgi:hypothetical protein